MSPGRHVAIAIVGYRNPGDILRCLDRLAASEHADFSVLICENGGPAACDGLRACLPMRLPGGQPVTLIDGGDNPGYAAGVNHCLAHSPHADAWWILNPDTEPAPAALGALLRRLARGDCDIVGGVIADGAGAIGSCGARWQPWLARAATLRHGGTADAMTDNPAGTTRMEARVSFVSGASMIVSRRFLETTGPMRTDYFLYAEEVEWCLRGTARGMRIGLAPDAHVLHRHGTTTGSAHAHRHRPALPVFLDQRNRILVLRDRFPTHLPIVAPLCLVATLLRYLRRGALRQCGYVVAGWLAGLRNERGRPRWCSD